MKDFKLSVSLFVSVDRETVGPHFTRIFLKYASMLCQLGEDEY